MWTSNSFSEQLPDSPCQGAAEAGPLAQAGCWALSTGVQPPSPPSSAGQRQVLVAAQWATGERWVTRRVQGRLGKSKWQFRTRAEAVHPYVAALAGTDAQRWAAVGFLGHGRGVGEDGKGHWGPIVPLPVKSTNRHPRSILKQQCQQRIIPQHRKKGLIQQSLTDASDPYSKPLVLRWCAQVTPVRAGEIWPLLILRSDPCIILIKGQKRKQNGTS